MDAIVHVALSNALAATVLAVVAAAVGYFCRRPAVVHGLWLLVLIKLVTPPLFDVPVLGWLAPTALAERPAADPQALELFAVVPQDRAVEEGGRLQYASVMQPPGAFIPDRERGAETVTALTAEETTSTQWTFPTVEWQTAALGVWTGGAFCWLLLMCVRIGQFHQLLRHASEAPPWLQQRAVRLAARMGLEQCPGVYLVPGRISPMLWSFGGPPRLLLPEELLERVSDDQLATLLVHELAHLRRRDNWVRGLELLVTCLYWWHPVVWWARRELQEAEEQCCDAWVVSLLPGSARSYATALVETVDFLSEARPVLPPAASGLGQVQDLRRRLTMIMRGTTPKGLSWRGVLGVFCLGALILPLVPSWARTAAEDDKVADKKKADLSSYEADVAKLRAQLAEAEAKLRAARVKGLVEDKKENLEKRAVFVVTPDGTKKQEVIELIMKDGVIQQRSGVPVKIIEGKVDGKPGFVEKQEFIFKSVDGVNADDKGRVTITGVADGKPGRYTIIASPDGKPGHLAITGTADVKPGQLTVTSTPDGKVYGYRLAGPQDGDARMKALEKRLDELSREVENLRRELKKDGGAAEPVRGRIRINESVKP